MCIEILDEIASYIVPGHNRELYLMMILMRLSPRFCFSRKGDNLGMSDKSPNSLTDFYLFIYLHNCCLN